MGRCPLGQDGRGGGGRQGRPGRARDGESEPGRAGTEETGVLRKPQHPPGTGPPSESPEEGSSQIPSGFHLVPWA